MAKLENVISSYVSADFTVKVCDAPKDAVTFDKMIVVFSSPLCKTIKMVTFYDTRTQKVTGSY